MSEQTASQTDAGELSPSQAPSSPAPSTRPRAESQRQPRWQDDLSAEGRHRANEESRRAEARDGATRDGENRDEEPRHQIGNLKLSEAEIRDVQARIAADESKKLTRPQKAEDFKFGLSSNFKPPPGLEFKLDENDPLVTHYREFAVKHGFTQEQFTEGVDLIAAIKVGEASEFQSAKKAELDKLGANANPRVSRVVEWLTAMAGDKAKAMIRVLEQAPVAETIEAFERIVQNYSTQGAAGFNASGRTNTDANSGKIQGYEKMTFEQRRHAQDQQRRR